MNVEMNWFTNPGSTKYISWSIQQLNKISNYIKDFSGLLPSRTKTKLVLMTIRIRMNLNKYHSHPPTALLRRRKKQCCSILSTTKAQLALK